MLIRCSMYEKGGKQSNVEVLVHDPAGMTAQEWEAFKRRRLKVNRPARRGESRNARKERIKAKHFYDNYRPIMGGTIVKGEHDLKPGDQVCFDEVSGMPKKAFEALYIGYRLSAVQFDVSKTEPPPYTHMKVKKK